MESALPHPPPPPYDGAIAAITAAVAATRASPSRLPLQSSTHRRSWPQQPTTRELSNAYPESISSSASASSSPEIAVADGAMIATPPKLELHELSYASEPISGAVDADKPTGQEHHSVALQSQSGIPSLGAAKSALLRPRAITGSTYLHGYAATIVSENASAKPLPSRIGRLEPRKKPPPPTIDTHWSSSGTGDVDCGMPPAASTDPIYCTVSPRRASPLSTQAVISSDGAAAASASSPRSFLPPPPVTPPPPAHSTTVAPTGDTIRGTDDALDPSDLQAGPPLRAQPPRSVTVQRLSAATVEPPKTPSGSAAFEAFADQDDENKLSASQRVRMGLSALMTLSTSAESERLGRRKSHDDELSASRSHRTGVAAPISCPPLFQTGGAGTQQFAALTPPRRASHTNSSKLLSSKLLPSRASLNSMMGYVRELYLSEASLRDELARTRYSMQRALASANDQASTLRESLQRAEHEREQAQARVVQQERVIRDLGRQVQQLQLFVQAADAALSEIEPTQRDELSMSPRCSVVASQPLVVAAEAAAHAVEFDTLSLGSAAAAPAVLDAGVDSGLTEATTAPALIPYEQHVVASPRAVKPLWEPWSSGSDSPLVAATPPMFTVAPSVSELLPSSPPLAPTIVSSVDNHDHELKSIVSPSRLLRCGASERSVQNTLPVTASLSPVAEDSVDVVPALFVASPPVFSLAAAATAAPVLGGGHHVSAIQTHHREMPHSPPQVHASASSLGMASPLEQPASSTTVPASPPPRSPPKLLAPVTHAAHSVQPPPARVPESSAGSLEALLIEFFLDVDKAKVRMADVYGRRYVGHEDRLFAELTRRYGNDKVAALQARFDLARRATAVNSHVEAVPHNNHDGPTYESVVSLPLPTVSPPRSTALEGLRELPPSSSRRASVSSEARIQKASPTARRASVSAHWDSPLMTGAANDMRHDVMKLSSVQTVGASALAQSVDASSDSEPAGGLHHMHEPAPKSPQRVSPQLRKSARFSATGVGCLNTDMPLHLPSDEFLTGGTKASPIMRQGEPSNGHLHALGEIRNGSDSTSSDDAAKRVVASAAPPNDRAVSATFAKSRVAEPPVTLERLLAEMYRKHQPDKLSNAAQVARTFAGRERELVVLLRAKYGALSVKRLEENLPQLEARGAKATTQRARWSTLLLRGAVAVVVGAAASGAALALLDSHVCSRVDFATPPDVASCAPLSSDLHADTFTVERVSSYAQQSYALDCFCVEWDEREAALRTNLAATDALALAKLLPFSRTAVGAFAANVQARESYVRFAQPVVDSAKQFVPAVQSTLADVGSAICERVSELHAMLFRATASRDSSIKSAQTLQRQRISEDAVDHSSSSGGTRDSAGSALTKVALASKSLLESAHEDPAVVAVDASSVPDERRDEPLDTAMLILEHTGEEKDTSDDDSAGVAAVVEVEVLQGWSDVSYSRDDGHELLIAVSVNTSVVSPQLESTCAALAALVSSDHVVDRDTISPEASELIDDAATVTTWTSASDSEITTAHLIEPSDQVTTDDVVKNSDFEADASLVDEAARVVPTTVDSNDGNDGTVKGLSDAVAASAELLGNSHSPSEASETESTMEIAAGQIAAESRADELIAPVQFSLDLAHFMLESTGDASARVSMPAADEADPATSAESGAAVDTVDSSSDVVVAESASGSIEHEAASSASSAVAAATSDATGTSSADAVDDDEGGDDDDLDFALASIDAWTLLAMANEQAAQHHAFTE